jgi:hypothetical protein
MNTFVGVPQPDSPRKSLPNLVDSVHMPAGTSRGAAFVSAARSLTGTGVANGFHGAR